MQKLLKINFYMKRHKKTITKDVSYPNIVYCPDDPRLFDDYEKPLDCMDLKKV